jgi:hypothetical protein
VVPADVEETLLAQLEQGAGTDKTCPPSGQPVAVVG